LIDEDLRGATQIVLTAHRRLPHKSWLPAWPPAALSDGDRGHTGRSIAQSRSFVTAEAGWLT